MVVDSNPNLPAPEEVRSPAWLVAAALIVVLLALVAAAPAGIAWIEGIRSVYAEESLAFPHEESEAAFPKAPSSPSSLASQEPGPE